MLNKILGENLLDLSHLPYAHHSVGSLNRTMGGALPTRMLSLAKRKKCEEWQTEFHKNGKEKQEIVLPTFQAELVDPAKHDPMFKAMLTRMKVADPTKLSTTVAYYDPCHVRYRRQTTSGPRSALHVELFMCPTSEGRSRVFLYNVFEASLPPPIDSEAKTNINSQPSLKERIMKLFSPKHWQGKIIQGMMKTPRPHMMSHSIFDGDGIFLHKQGNRMKQAGLSYRDYSTPSSCDSVLNAYRRFIDTAATITRQQTGLSNVADSVQGSSMYGDDLSRSNMLDRYNTHTKDCPICRKALQNARRKRSRLKIFQSVFQGSAGASGTALATLIMVAKGTTIKMAPIVFRYVFGAMFATCLASFLSIRKEKKLQQEINSYIFEDYIHADKN